MPILLFSMLAACSGKSQDSGELQDTDSNPGADTDTNSDTDSDTNTSDDSPFAGLDYVLTDAQGYTPVSQAIYLTFPSGAEFQFHGDCNTFYGAFSINGNTFNAGNIGGTEMGCDNALLAEDEWLVSFFYSQPTFDLRQNSLVLESNGVILTFGDRDDEEPVPFEETLWIIDTFIDGDAASAYNLTSVPSVRFGLDGQIDLNTGCNGGLGEYTLDGETLSVNMTTYTDAFCSDENAQNAESIIVSVFMGPTVAVEASETRITLTNGNRGISAYASE